MVVQSLSCVCLFVTPWTATWQAALTSAIFRSLLKFMSTELVTIQAFHPLPPFSLCLQSFPMWPLPLLWPKDWRFSIRTTTWCGSATPGHTPYKTISPKDKSTPVFTEAQLAIAKTWKQPKCPPTYIEDVVHIYRGIIVFSSSVHIPFKLLNICAGFYVSVAKMKYHFIT